MTRLSCALAFVVLLLCYSAGSVNSAGLANNAAETTSYLYDALRRVAFPASPELDDAKTNVENRFILMMPGKTLNYFDYYPGPEYTEFIQNPNRNMKYAVVPPHTMENWFDLADIIPSANPLNGQDTGRSLATIYRQILEQITITNLKEQGEKVLAFYNQAVGFLNEEVPDPENTETNTTRLALYKKYKEQYDNRKLEMEGIIETNRKKMHYIDYEMWFQRHYPPLASKVETAYIRWLIFGQKEMCNLYITHLDTGTSAKALEEARVVMRSAGVVSLDRTRTIYPVDFEPSDWYKYLLPPLEEKPSRTELQDTLGKINTKMANIDRTISYYNTNKERLNNLLKKLEETKKAAAETSKTTLSSYLDSNLKCTVQNMGIDTQEPNSCDNMTSLSQELTSALKNESDSMASVGEYTWSPTNKADFIRSLKKQKDELQTQRELIQASLGKVDPLVGGILNMDSLAVASIIDSHKDDQWMQFQFDSETYKNEVERESSHQSFYSTSSVVCVFNAFCGRPPRYYYKSDSQSNQDDLAQASLKVKGKLLRVFIKRPWFKPEFFDDRKLNFIGNTPNNNRVLGAPGKELSERQFIEKITSEEVIYRLPEYVTSFLLARDIELEFSNIKRKTFRDTVSCMSKNSGSCQPSFLIFSTGGSHTKSSSSRSTSKVHRTANGMKIMIPGAQVIGYYTQKLPKFPAGA